MSRGEQRAIEATNRAAWRRLQRIEPLDEAHNQARAALVEAAGGDKLMLYGMAQLALNMQRDLPQYELPDIIAEIAEQAGAEDDG